MGSLMADLETNLTSINKTRVKRGKEEINQDQLLIKLFDEVSYVWPKIGYPPLVTPFSQYVKNLALMNVIQMEKGAERWSMIADDIWDMILGKAGRLPGEVSPEIIEKAKAEGREFFTGDPQANYPDALEGFRAKMQEKGWELGRDDEELFEYAMHPAQYEAYKSGKAKADFEADIAKRTQPAAPAPAAAATAPVAGGAPQTMTIDVNGEKFRVTVAYGDQPETTAAPAAAPATPVAPVATPASGKHELLSPLEGKFMLTKAPGEKAKKPGDIVKKGEVLCYIEAMKTYNAILSEWDGSITEITVENGSSVAEDDVLMRLS